MLKRTCSILLALLIALSTVFVGLSASAESNTYNVYMYNSLRDSNNIKFTKTIQYTNAVDGKRSALKNGMTVELFLVGQGTAPYSYGEARNKGYKPAFCVYPNASVITWQNYGYYRSFFNKYYNKMSSNLKKALGYLSSVAVPGTYSGRAACYATQLIYWEFITGKRSATTYRISDNNKFINAIAQYSNSSNAISKKEIKEKYDAIDKALVNKGITPKGTFYNAGSKKTISTSYYNSTKDANSHSKVVGGQTSKTATYKFTYKLTINNANLYTGWQVVDTNGKKASGTNGKFKVSVKGNNITIQSKKSTQDYYKTDKSNYYLTFSQKNKSVKTLAGNNITFGVNSSPNTTMQNVAQAFSVPTKKYYIALSSNKYEKASLKIIKSVKDTDGNYKTASSYLSGWYFKVSGQSKPLVTDSNGETGTLTNLPYGKYAVTELGRKISTSSTVGKDEEEYTNVTQFNGVNYGFPKNYIANKTQTRIAGSKYSTARSKTVTISKDTLVTFDYINVVNEQKKIRVQKTTDEGPSDGFYFKVYDATKENNCIDTQIVGPTEARDISNPNNSYTDYIKTKKNQSFTLGVKELGVYKSGDKSKESSYEIPDEYDKPDSDTCRDITEDEQTVTVKVHNTCSGNIVIGKVDATNNKFLKGAEYGIFYNEVYADKQTNDGEYSDNTDSPEATVEDKDNPDYTYEDDSDAEDTDFSTGEGENDTDIEKDKDKTPEGVTEEDTDSDVDDSSDIDTGKVIDTDDDINAGEDIPEEDITLPEVEEGSSEYHSDSKWLAQGNNLADTVKIDKEGLENYSNMLPIGTYYVQETKAPDGYVLSDKVYKVTIAPDRKNERAVHVTAEDNPTHLEFYKTDITGENELEGAHLEVIDKDNNVVDSWTSTKEPHSIYALKIGETYTLRETIAPEGYTTTNDVVFKVLDTAEIQKVTMKDEITQIEISKKDVTTSEELEGAKLKVIDENNNVVESWTSGKEPHKITGLTYGKTYTLKETIAPDGYVTSSDIKFTVKDTTEIQKVVMYDDITKVNIKKLGENGYLKGAKLQVSDEDGKVIDTWTTNGSYHRLTKLVVGKIYTLSELSAPKGYATADDIEFTVKDTAKVQTFTMVDKKTNVEINKTDITGKKELKGAELQVIDSNGKEIDSWTSNGKSHKIKGLTVNETYTLIEKFAPKGYAYSEDVDFTIDDTYEVQKVTMTDDVTKINVEKVNKSGKQLAGAKLEILDDNGNVVYTFTSTNESEAINGVLEAGATYTLREVKAPKGYTIAEDVEFTVPDTGSCNVKMVDHEITTSTPPTKTGSNNWWIGLVAIITSISGFATAFILKKKFGKQN